MYIGEYLFFISISVLFFTWIGYPIILFLLNKLTELKKDASAQNKDGEYEVPISVIIAAHNEEKGIKDRVHDIYSGSYPGSLIETIIASDGSTDSTVQISENLIGNYLNIKVLDLQPQAGRARAHNEAVKKASGDIIVFTDVDTRFHKHFLKRMIGEFKNVKIGFVSGCLQYINSSSSGIQKNANIYWKFELWLRKLEARLGLLCVGSGACCAVKKLLYKSIPPTGDVDFTTPLDVVLSGFYCQYAPEAIAYDFLPASAHAEFRSRIRMTAKNFHGTIVRWGLNGFLSHPLYSLSLLFHKIFRWMTPHFMIVLFFSNISIFNKTFFYSLALAAQMIFYVIAVSGFLKVNIPGASVASNFVLANIGFFIGVNRALLGRIPSAYKPINRSC